MSLRPALVALVISVLLAPAFAAEAQAQTSHPRRVPPPPKRAWEGSFGLVYTDYERDVDLDDEFGFGARFGYLFTPNHQIDFLWNFVWTDDTVFPGIDVVTNNLQAAYVYNFTKSGVVPYLTAGLGLFITDDESLGDEADLTLGLGAGVRFFIGPAAHLRLEYRHNQFEGDGDVYADNLDVSVEELTIAFGWRFPLR